MKKVFLLLIVAGAIGVIGSGVLDNYVALDTQDMSKFDSVLNFDNFNCDCEDPLNPGATCNIADTADMSCGP